MRAVNKGLRCFTDETKGTSEGPIVYSAYILYVFSDENTSQWANFISIN